MAQKWKPPKSKKTETRIEAYVNDIRLENLQSSLPPNVFLLSITAATARSTKKDQTYAVGKKRIHPSNNYPYEWVIPGKMPIMKRQSAYFNNPAQNPPKGKNPWSFDGFFKRYNEMMKLVGSTNQSVVDRTYIKGITVVEVHDRHFCSTTSTGRRQWDWEQMSKNNTEMGIAKFSMRGSGFSNENVKDKLATSLAGDTKKPIKLVESRLVNAKSPNHDDRAKKYHYYTTNEWQNGLYSDYGLSPKIIDCEQSIGSKQKSNKTVVSNHIPALVSSKFIRLSKLSGPVENKEDFQPDSVSFL